MSSSNNVERDSKLRNLNFLPTESFSVRPSEQLNTLNEELAGRVVVRFTPNPESTVEHARRVRVKR